MLQVALTLQNLWSSQRLLLRQKDHHDRTQLQQKADLAIRELEEMKRAVQEFQVKAKAHMHAQTMDLQRKNSDLEKHNIELSQSYHHLLQECEHQKRYGFNHSCIIEFNV